MYASPCSIPIVFLAWWLMYRSLLTRRRVNMTLRAMEMAKYGRVNCTVVDVQSDALGRDD